jgi:hypothetical protein
MISYFQKDFLRDIFKLPLNEGFYNIQMKHIHHVVYHLEV